MRKILRDIPKAVLGLTACLLLTIPIPATAQEGAQDYVIGKAIKIRSSVLNEERILLVHLPDEYDQTQAHYPVLYLLDGNSHFHNVTGIVQFFFTRKIAPPMIVVALPNVDRNRDFTPTKVQRKPTSGGGERFLSFFRQEVIPYVDGHYRTHPYRILVGHSLGGMFSVHTLLTQPDLFQAYIVISPGLGFDNEYVLNNAPAILENQTSLKKYLYMTLGNEPSYVPRLEAFCQILENKAPEDLEWSYTYMGKEDHFSVTHKSIYNGLETLYSDWRVTEALVQKGINEIEDHYKALSEKFGYEIPVPARVYNLVGYELIKVKKIKEAIEVFDMCVKVYPEYWYAYSNLGYCHMIAGNKELAVKNLEKALELNPQDKLSAQRLQQLKKEKSRS